MLTTLAAGFVAALTLAQTDTVIVPVRTGTLVEVDNFSGSVTVRAWDRPSVRVVAEHGEQDQVDVDNEEGVVSISGSGPMGLSGRIDYQITVPASTPLEISGVSTSVAVEGVKADVSVETVQGDIRVTGGSGFLSLSTVEGSVDLQKTGGRIEVSSVNQSVRVTDATGDITAETVNGSLRLERVESSNVEASTINGEVVYVGSIKDGGRYHFSTHNGDLSVTLPPTANATVTVETYQGDLQSSFPVDLRESRHGDRSSFTLGSGSARVDLESFQGTIRLRRPGEAVPADTSSRGRRSERRPAPRESRP